MQASARLSSSPASRKAIAGVSSAITRSFYRTSRGKAHAAPLSAQEPPSREGQKRITKQERRIRIVEFVENFRASNDGKFPTIKNVRRQLGGSHYTVREILQEIEYNHAKLPLVNAKAAPLKGTVEVANHSMAKDEAKIAESQGTVEVSEHTIPKDEAEVAQLQGTVEVSEFPMPKDDGKVAQLQGIFESAEHSKPQEDSEKAAKHDLDTSETCKTAECPTLFNQTESESMKVQMDKPSISSGVEAKPNSGNQQREIEADKLDLKNSEKFLNARDTNASDQSGSDMVIEAKTHSREEKPKHQPEESLNTGLLGGLKSFAYGIRNFWKNL